jgi:DUF2971 family protein
MWRAYSETTGVALVLNNSVFLNPSNGFGAYASPVAYLDAQDFETEFSRIADNISEATDFVRSRPREEIKNRIFNVLRLSERIYETPRLSRGKGVASRLLSDSGEITISTKRNRGD